MTTDVDPLTALMLENPPSNTVEMRALVDGFSMMMNQNLPEIGASLDDILIEHHEPLSLSVDIHKPKGEGPFPILIYLHGGGWVLGSTKTHRRLGFRFAEAGYLVFNVQYRLAPEAPFPAAFDDCVQALDWVIAHASEYGGDVDRLAMGGDSAGGNLTAAVATHAANADRLKCLLLIYPAMDFASMGASMEPLPDGEVGVLDMMIEPYIGHDRDALLVDPRVSPIHASNPYPEALITCGTADDLIHDCHRLEKKLTAAGTTFETDYYNDMPHGFVQMEEMYPEARQSIDKMIEFLHRTLG